jgi:hypothetical protein
MKKLRSIVRIADALVVCSLVSCNMGGATIEQRISIFQSDLNTSDRRNICQDFIPSVTDYTALKNPSFLLYH